MIQNMTTKKNIYTLWDNLNAAKNKDSYNLNQFNQTNLWIFKNQNNRFGFIITNTFSSLKSEYKNINIVWKQNLKDSITGNKLTNCLIVESSNIIDSRLFCSAISSIFDVEDNKHQYKKHEIEIALNEIEAITLKDNDEFNEVIGVWGELFLLNELISKSSKIESQQEIINSWEGLNTRTKIDFNFKSKNVKIEVKTTTELTRQHHFNGLAQVTNEFGNSSNGYLASFCISIIDNGDTCKNLVELIRNVLPENLTPFFNERLKIRGKVCLNEKYKFQITDWRLFNFSDVPKPIIDNDILKVEWEANLDNKTPLTEKAKIELLTFLSD